MTGILYLNIFAGLISVAMAKDPFYMCTDNKCETCPSSVASTGTGYPDCVIYNSEDVFANQGYSGSEGGGYQVYFDIQAQDPGCATIIKSPAGTDLTGCGAAAGVFKQPACALLNLETSFMVQSCCGTDCDSAGIGNRIRGLGPIGTVHSVSLDGRGGLLLKYANGTVIEPAEIGSPAGFAQKTKRQEGHGTAHRLQKRGCTKESWKGGEVLTKPADNVQIVYEQEVVGGGDVEVTTERTQTYTTSLSLGVADIISLGVSTEFSESVSTSKSVKITIPEGQSGRLGFTATLSCSTGKGQCDDGEVEGEVCWPTIGSDGDIVGTYRVIVQS